MRFFTPSEISLQLRRACARAGARTNAIRTGMIDETSNSLMELQEGGTHSTLMAFDFDLVGEWDWICPAFGKKGVALSLSKNTNQRRGSSRRVAILLSISFVNRLDSSMVLMRLCYFSCCCCYLLATLSLFRHRSSSRNHLDLRSVRWCQTPRVR